MCVAVKQQPHLFLPRVYPPFSRSPLLSSSLTLRLIREESFHYLLRLGCQSPRPWPKFVVLPRHIGEMISGVISPPLREAFIPPRCPPYLQARSGSLTGRLLLSFHSSTLSPPLHLLILHHVLHPSKCLCSLLSQIHFNASLSLLFFPSLFSAIEPLQFWLCAWSWVTLCL